MAFSWEMANFGTSVKWISTWETMEGRKCFDFTSEERRLLEGKIRRRFRRVKECGTMIFLLKYRVLNRLYFGSVACLSEIKEAKIWSSDIFAVNASCWEYFFPATGAGPQWFNLQSIKTCTGLISFIGENLNFSSRVNWENHRIPYWNSKKREVDSASFRSASFSIIGVFSHILCVFRSPGVLQLPSGGSLANTYYPDWIC